MKLKDDLDDASVKSKAGLHHAGSSLCFCLMSLLNDIVHSAITVLFNAAVTAAQTLRSSYAKRCS